MFVCLKRHSFKANVWIAIFSFIGNWWYTHYFYSVLEASYSMPGHDVNAVPIAMFLATHFYFTLYHALAAKALRAVTKLYQPGKPSSPLLLLNRATRISCSCVGHFFFLTMRFWPCPFFLS